MAREALNWTALDPSLRHMAIVGLSIRQQARRLGISERAIVQRRAVIGLRRRDLEKRERREKTCA